MYEGKEYKKFVANARNILDFYIYEMHKLKDNHYFIRPLKTLNIQLIYIPSVGWVNIGL